MSLVEVSPSTVTRLKVRATTSCRASSSISWVMAQSVVMKQSMVPMLGWIMPEPLAMAPRVTSFPPRVRETASSFFTVSVVMMARAASSEPLRASAAASRRAVPAWMAAMLMVWPMTPVEATTKSSGSRPVAWAAARRTWPRRSHGSWGSRRWRCRCWPPRPRPRRSPGGPW